MAMLIGSDPQLYTKLCQAIGVVDLVGLISKPKLNNEKMVL